MPVTTTPELLDALQKTGLLADDALERAALVVAAETDVRQAARQLIQEKILTHWQARQILAGVTNLRLGKYRLLDELGRNLLGRIYLAEHHQLARRAAVTLLSRQLSERPGAVRKFLDRAQAAAALNNPHLIQTLDVAQEANRFYVVFEFAEGRDFAERLREDGPPDVLVAIDWLQQAADGVAYLHERQIVHGNLRPELLLVDDHAVVRLLDLGVAKLSKQARAAAEATDPQQPPDPFADERPAETRDDIQALIGIFHQLLTGQELPASTLDEAQLKSFEEAVELRLPGSGTPLANLFRLWTTPPAPSDTPSTTSTGSTSTAATAISAAQIRDQLLRLHQQLKPPPIAEQSELPVDDVSDVDATTEELDPALENMVSEAEVDSLLLSTNRPDGSGKRRSPSSVIRRDHSTAESVMAGEDPQSQQLLLRSPKSMKGKGDAAHRGDRAAAKKDKAKRSPEKDGAGGAKKRQVLLIAVVASLACVLLLGAVTLGIVLALSRQSSGPTIAQNQPPTTVPATPNKTAAPKETGDDTSEGEIPSEPPVMDDPAPATKPGDPLTKPETPKPETPKPNPPTPPPAKPARDPFQDFPKDAVELPLLLKDGAAAPMAFDPQPLGKIYAPPKSLVIVHLLGGEGAIKAKQKFVLEAGAGGTADREWEVFLRDENAMSGGTKIARLNLTNDELLFRWEHEAESNVASPHLMNCMLQFGAGAKSHYVALRKPMAGVGIPFDLNKPANMKGRWDIPYPPNPAKMKLELQFGPPFPPQRYEPPNAQKSMDAEKGAAFVWLGAQPEDQVICLKLESTVRKTLDVTVDPMFRLGIVGKPERFTPGNWKKAQALVGATVVQSNAAVQNWQMIVKQKNDVTNKERLAQAEEAQKQSQILVRQFESVKTLSDTLANARVQVRVVYQADDRLVELLKTSD